MHFHDTLPLTEEACELAESLELEQTVDLDDRLALTVPHCPHLRAVYLTGVRDLTDRTVNLLARSTDNLTILDISGCRNVTDVGILELVAQATHLQIVRLNSIVGLTDPAISAIARSLPHLAELELCGLPMITAGSVRDIWTFSRKLKKLVLARCSHITNKGFPEPSSLTSSPTRRSGARASTTVATPQASHRNSEATRSVAKSTPPTWLDALPPLILAKSHILDNFRVLDLSNCTKLTDEAVIGTIAHAPKLRQISVAGCSLLTDRSVMALCRLTACLESVTLCHLEMISDTAVIQLVRACPRLSAIDIAFCTNLTDLAVLDIASLPHLRRLSVTGIPRVTNIALCSLAETAPTLTHLHISQCKGISLDTVQVILRRLTHLEYLAGSGILALTRVGISRFSEQVPLGYDERAQGPYRVFRESNIFALRSFLDKEEQRRQEAERRNIIFTPRADDRLNLY